jgi:crossover junction endodeoxyribonuclease RuvC
LTVIGIDPGLTGAVAVLSDYPLLAVPMPVTDYSPTGFVKRAVDLYALADLLVRYPSATVYLERVNAMPGQGVAGMFSLGMSYWGVAGVAAGLGLPVKLVTPQEWKRYFGLSADKDMARQLAQRLFPDVDLSRKKDHGRAEALLIAKYGLDMEAKAG